MQLYIWDTCILAYTSVVEKNNEEADIPNGVSDTATHYQGLSVQYVLNMATITEMMRRAS